MTDTKKIIFIFSLIYGAIAASAFAIDVSPAISISAQNILITEYSDAGNDFYIYPKPAFCDGGHSGTYACLSYAEPTIGMSVYDLYGANDLAVGSYSIYEADGGLCDELDAEGCAGVAISATSFVITTPESAAKVTINTNLAGQMADNVSSQLTDTGTLRWILTAAGVYLVFWVMRRIINLVPKDRDRVSDR